MESGLRKSLESVRRIFTSDIMELPEMFTETTPRKVTFASSPSGLTGNVGQSGYTVIVGSDFSETRVAALQSALGQRGVDSRMLGQAAHHKSKGIWMDHGVIAKDIEEADQVIFCVDAAVFEHVNSFNFGDGLASAFNVTCGHRRILVAILEPRYLDANSWGWSPLFARFAGLVLVDASSPLGTEAWAGSVDAIREWCFEDAVTDSRRIAKSTTQKRVQDAKPQPPPTHPCPLADNPVHMRSDDKWLFRTPWLHALKNSNGKRSYDCFLTHNWGQDDQGRDNHIRATQIAMSLRANGLEVFLDDWEMHRYRNIDEAMAMGMQHSTLVIVLLTRRYVDKINEGRVADNCVAEFNLARRTPGVIVAVMEHELRNPGKWGCNAIFAQLSKRLYIDLSADAGPSFRMMGCSSHATAVQRWRCGLDALEMRIRTDSAMIEGIQVCQRPPPFIPHRNLVVAMSYMFLFAAALDVISFLQLHDIFPVEILSFLQALAWAAWSAGFGVQAFLTFITSRKPPEFNVHWVEVPWVLVGANFARSLGAAVGLVNEMLALVPMLAAGLQDETVPSGAVPWLTPAAIWILFLGNSLNLFSTVFFQVNSEQGLDTTFVFCYRNLPHGAVFGLALSSLALILRRAVTHSVLVAKEEVAWTLQLIGLILMLLSVLLLRFWVMTNDQSMRRYFRASQVRIMSDQPLPFTGSASAARDRSDPDIEVCQPLHTDVEHGSSQFGISGSSAEQLRSVPEGALPPQATLMDTISLASGGALPVIGKQTRTIENSAESI